MKAEDLAAYMKVAKGIVGPLQKFRERGLKRKKTYGEMAASFGVSTNSLRAWLDGETTPGLGSLHTICRVLNTQGIAFPVDIKDYLEKNPQPKQAKKPKKTAKRREPVLAKRKTDATLNKKLKSAATSLKSENTMDILVRRIVREELQSILGGAKLNFEL